MNVDLEAFSHVLSARNPAGVLTAELNEAIITAATLEQPTLVVVDGEEDLAPCSSTFMFPFTPSCFTANPA